MAFDRWLERHTLAKLTTPEEFVDRFGPVVERDASPQANRHVPGQTDSILTLRFDGPLVARFYAVTGGRSLPMSVDVAAPGLLGTEGVDVGTPWPLVEASFGPPDGTREGDPYYVCDCKGAEEPVVFQISGGVVRAIRFHYYVD
ncbi:MAG: hypothetical protein P8188_13465 [Gemmatimonadota bacterium]